MASQYRLILCDSHGVGVAELEDADITKVTLELNAEGALDFAVRTNDPKAGLIKEAAQEVQLLRNGSVLFWGVPIRTRKDSQAVSVQCAGLRWYFGKRRFGRNYFLNFLGNASFESGLAAAGTFVQGNWSAHGVTANLVTGWHFLGNQSVNLVQSNPNVDTFVNQQVPTIPSTAYFATAWLHIRGDVPYYGPAYGNRGLFLVTYDASGNVLDTANAVIDGTFNAGQSYRMATSIITRSGTTGGYMEVRLYAPGGSVIWDAASVTIEESVSLVPSGSFADQAAYVNAIVQHAQGKNADGTTIPSPGSWYPGTVAASYPAALGKTDLNIGTNCPNSGVTVWRDYPYEDHTKIDDALTEFSNLNNGLDMDIVFPNPTTRTFTTFYPREGIQTPRTGITLELGRNIADFIIDTDGDQTFTSITVLNSDSSGPGREEANSTDASATNGLVLEETLQSIPGSGISSLQGAADEELRRARYPVPIPQLTTYPNTDLLGVIGLGDVVPVIIQYGSINIDDNYRVVRLEINPADDSMVITVNHL